MSDPLGDSRNKCYKLALTQQVVIFPIGLKFVRKAVAVTLKFRKKSDVIGSFIEKRKHLLCFWRGCSFSAAVP